MPDEVKKAPRKRTPSTDRNRIVLVFKGKDEAVYEELLKQAAADDREPGVFIVRKLRDAVSGSIALTDEPQTT